jgi:hypothetical protein
MVFIWAVIIYAGGTCVNFIKTISEGNKEMFYLSAGKKGKLSEKSYLFGQNPTCPVSF